MRSLANTFSVFDKPVRWGTRTGLAHRRQSGAGMIEVLVAIVIVAFALLGMAGLQMASLRYQKVSHFRGLATQYQSEIAERIRANIGAANAGNYAATGSYPSPTCAPYVRAACTSEACVATEDVKAWRANLSCGLAGGWGEIEDRIAGQGYLLVTVYFREPGKAEEPGAAADPNCRASVDSSVRCFTTVVVP